MEVSDLILSFSERSKSNWLRIFWLFFIGTFKGIHFGPLYIHHCFLYFFSLSSTASKPISWHQTEWMERMKSVVPLLYSNYYPMKVERKFSYSGKVQISVRWTFFSTNISSMDKAHLVFFSIFVVLLLFFTFRKRNINSLNSSLVAVKLINVLIVIQCSQCWKFATITIFTPAGSHFCLMHFRILNTFWKQWNRWTTALVRSKRFQYIWINVCLAVSGQYL